MGLHLDVEISGPLIDGRVEHAIVVGLDDALDKTGRRGVDLVRFRLHGVLRHPTGHYESLVQSDRAGSDRVITDGHCVYGPWLEGVSQRNQSTRFKGYATFRRTVDELSRQAGPIADRAISDRIGAL